MTLGERRSNLFVLLKPRLCKCLQANNWIFETCLAAMAKGNLVYNSTQPFVLASNGRAGWHFRLSAETFRGCVQINLPAGVPAVLPLGEQSQRKFPLSSASWSDRLGLAEERGRERRQSHRQIQVHNKSRCRYPRRLSGPRRR